MEPRILGAMCALLLGAAACAAGESPDWPRLARSVELADVMRLAATHSAGVETAGALWRASTRRKPQVIALADPRLQYLDWLRQMTPQEERWMLELSQELPLPEKRRLAGRIADRDAQIAYLTYQAAVRDALVDGKEAFFELYYIDRAMRITGEIRRLYDRYTALAAGGAAPGGAALPELFRGESQRAQLGYDVVQLRSMRVSEEERLRAALGAPDETPIGSTGEVAEPVGGPPPLGDLKRLAHAYSQELAAAGLEIEKSDDQVRLAELARAPDFMLGTRYMRTGGQGFARGDPTEDPIIVMAGVTLPIWGDKNRARIDEARDRRSAARGQRRMKALQIRSSLARAHYGLTNALRLVRLYRGTLLPQARQALQSAEQLARSADASMLSVLETTSTVHNFELAALRATVDAYQNMARIEKIIGRALPMTSRPPAATAREAIPEGED